MKGNWIWVLALTGIVLSGLSAADKKQERDLEEHFKKWLEQDVLYIITAEEKSVFKNLTTPEEKQNFIDQFWRRRDPTPENAYNEFKEEYYRRIQYANERFASGIPGWKTDRGMTYIKFGPPDRTESHPTGGHYQRMSWEGGGSTSTYPFERWEYRYIAGVGQDIELEFVDDTLSGEYRLTMNPDDKDALLRMPGGGLTDAEMMGMASRVDRIVKKTSPMPGHNPLLIGYGRAKDQPFEKLQLLTNIQRPPEIQFRDLRAVVTTEVKFSQLPVEVQTHSFRIREDQYLVPVTVGVENKVLQYKGLGDILRAELQIYGRLTSVTGRVAQEFEDLLASDFRKEEFQRLVQGRSIYQKLLHLEPGRYKLDLVIKDVASTQVGTAQSLIVVQRIPTEDMALSSVILADRIDSQVDSRSAQGQFMLGDVKVYPNTRAEFAKDRDLLLYFQVYNLGVDQATRSPSGEIVYKVLSGERELVRLTQPIRELEAADGKVSVVQAIPMAELQPGSYRLRVEVQDFILSRNASREESFKLP
ncbi:MAG: GWxTD domain-containing protein [Acidobacteria bacterium]|nr:GWxTD domain-containing protein [Acidobacteriota bacterium]